MIKKTGTVEKQVCDTDNTNIPLSPVKLIFIHHSCGENWLADGNGGLGTALRDNNYFTSDTNYGWGEKDLGDNTVIGDNTDIGHFWLWFRGSDSGDYMKALYSENRQHSNYSRLTDEPSGENEVIMFKGCYPNSNLRGSAGDIIPPISENPLRSMSCWTDYHTLANAKGIYIDILEYFSTRQDKLFIAVTAPPVLDPKYAVNARVFNEWLVKEWLSEYPNNNVAVFDLYNVLTSCKGNQEENDAGEETGSHHRWWNNRIQHIVGKENGLNPDVLKYPAVPGNNHPSRAGSIKATSEFVKLLNIYYNRWKEARKQTAGRLV